MKPVANAQIHMLVELDHLKTAILATEHLDALLEHCTYPTFKAGIEDATDFQDLYHVLLTLYHRCSHEKFSVRERFHLDTALGSDFMLDDQYNYFETSSFRLFRTVFEKLNAAQQSTWYLTQLFSSISNNAHKQPPTYFLYSTLRDWAAVNECYTVSEVAFFDTPDHHAMQKLFEEFKEPLEKSVSTVYRENILRNILLHLANFFKRHCIHNELLLEHLLLHSNQDAMFSILRSFKDHLNRKMLQVGVSAGLTPWNQIDSFDFNITNVNPTTLNINLVFYFSQECLLASDKYFKEKCVHLNINYQLQALRTRVICRDPTLTIRAKPAQQHQRDTIASEFDQFIKYEMRHLCEPAKDQFSSPPLSPIEKIKATLRRLSPTRPPRRAITQ